MDNIEIVLYLLLSLGWFLLQSRKKKKQKKNPPQPIDVKNTPDDLPSFEEQQEMLEPERSLLRELLGKEEISEATSEEPIKPSEYQDYHHSFEEESLENLKERVRKRKEDKPQRFEPYTIGKGLEVQEEEAHPIKQWLLEDDEGPKKAIILSEVLRRKYK